MIEKSLTSSGSSFSVLHFWEKNVVIGGIEVWVAFLQFLVKLNTIFCGRTQSSPSLSVYVELDMWWVVFDFDIMVFQTECFSLYGSEVRVNNKKSEIVELVCKSVSPDYIAFQCNTFYPLKEFLVFCLCKSNARIVLN